MISEQAFTFPKQIPAFNTLSTKNRSLLRCVRNFIDKDLNINNLGDKHTILAVSGGADSLALLCIWHWLKPIYNHSFSIVHINHCLRSESFAEAKTIHYLCQAWKIKCHIHEIDIASLAQMQKKGIEEMARKERYLRLEYHRSQEQASWICLGHHLQDLQEDIIMRLLRGSGWPALGGMVAKDSQRHILRPLLLQEPQNLRNILNDINMTWAEDASNADTQYLRNRIRHNLLPLLHNENPAFAQKAKELWTFAQCDQEYWHAQLSKLCSQYNIECQNNKVCLSNKMLKTMHKSTRLRLYVHALSLLRSTTEQIGQARADTLLKLDQAWIEGRGNTVFQLPGRISARLKSGNITFKETL